MTRIAAQIEPNYVRCGDGEEYVETIFVLKDGRIFTGKRKSGETAKNCRRRFLRWFSSYEFDKFEAGYEFNEEFERDPRFAFQPKYVEYYNSYGEVIGKKSEINISLNTKKA